MTTITETTPTAGTYYFTDGTTYLVATKRHQRAWDLAESGETIATYKSLGALRDAIADVIAPFTESTKAAEAATLSLVPATPTTDGRDTRRVRVTVEEARWMQTWLEDRQESHPDVEASQQDAALVEFRGAKTKRQRSLCDAQTVADATYFANEFDPEVVGEDEAKALASLNTKLEKVYAKAAQTETVAA